MSGDQQQPPAGDLAALADDRLDGGIDDAAWAALVARHGDALADALDRARRVRAAFAGLPRPALPADLRARLLAAAPAAAPAAPIPPAAARAAAPVLRPAGGWRTWLPLALAAGVAVAVALPVIDRDGHAAPAARPLATVPPPTAEDDVAPSAALAPGGGSLAQDRGRSRLELEAPPEPRSDAFAGQADAARGRVAAKRDTAAADVARAEDKASAAHDGHLRKQANAGPPVPSTPPPTSAPAPVLPAPLAARAGKAPDDAAPAAPAAGAAAAAPGKPGGGARPLAPAPAVSAPPAIVARPAPAPAAPAPVATPAPVPAPKPQRGAEPAAGPLSEPDLAELARQAEQFAPRRAAPAPAAVAAGPVELVIAFATSPPAGRLVGGGGAGGSGEREEAGAAHDRAPRAVAPGLPPSAPTQPADAAATLPAPGAVTAPAATGAAASEPATEPAVDQPARPAEPQVADARDNAARAKGGASAVVLVLTLRNRTVAEQIVAPGTLRLIGLDADGRQRWATVLLADETLRLPAGGDLALRKVVPRPPADAVRLVLEHRGERSNVLEVP